MRRVRNPTFAQGSGPHEPQLQRIRVQVRLFMNGLASDVQTATFDEIRASLPPPDRNAPDGVIHQALIDEGFGDDVET